MSNQKDLRFIIPWEIYNNLGAKSQMMLYPYPGLDSSIDSNKNSNKNSNKLERKQKPINNLIPSKNFGDGNIYLKNAPHPIFLTSYYNNK